MNNNENIKPEFADYIEDITSKLLSEVINEEKMNLKKTEGNKEAEMVKQVKSIIEREVKNYDIQKDGTE